MKSEPPLSHFRCLCTPKVINNKNIAENMVSKRAEYYDSKIELKNTNKQNDDE